MMDFNQSFFQHSEELTYHQMAKIIIEPTGAEPDALPINTGLIATLVPGENDQLKKTLMVT